MSSAMPADAYIAVKSTPGRDESGHHEVDIVDALDRDCPAEHVAEDEQEHGALQGADHHKLW